MVAKNRSVFTCQHCGYKSSKWLGRCPDCGEWNTFVEEVLPARSAGSRSARQSVSSSASTAVPVRVDEIQYTQGGARILTGITEFDRVLGGGIVRGELGLIGGDPGIGKSTLLMQAADALSGTYKVLYVSGEESAQQMKLRADRLSLSHRKFLVMNETNAAAVAEALENGVPDFVIIDSIQTMVHPELSGAAGSVGQVREVTSLFLNIAKQKQISVFLIGHITKEGSIAGPKLLEHIVDCVLYFEGEKQGAFRILRAVKNRFGSTDEIGVFEMRETGLVEMKDPSSFFLGQRTRGTPGSALSVVMEGTRPLLVEVQALSVFSPMIMPRRVSSGIDFNKLALIAAVLEKTAGLNLRNQEIYVKTAGGLRITEPACDLAIAMAVAGSYKNSGFKDDPVFIGEVGLSGHVRPVSSIVQRVREAVKLGFTNIIMPDVEISGMPPEIRPVKIGTLGDAIRIMFGKGHVSQPQVTHQEIPAPEFPDEET